MDRRNPEAGQVAAADVPTTRDPPDVSAWGLQWSDIQLIRDRLAMTPTERLQTAQEFMNTVIRIRAQHGDRAEV